MASWRNSLLSMNLVVWTISGSLQQYSAVWAQWTGPWSNCICQEALVLTWFITEWPFTLRNVHFKLRWHEEILKVNMDTLQVSAKQQQHCSKQQWQKPASIVPQLCKSLCDQPGHQGRVSNTAFSTAKQWANAWWCPVSKGTNLA